MTRIPLSTDLKTRTLAPDKDARLKNCYIEGKGDPQSQNYQTIVRKRPAATGGYPVNATSAQGGIGSANSLVVVNGDVLTTAISANTTLTTQSNVLAFGATTITLPTSPTAGQSVTISNLGSGIITIAPVGINIPAGGIGWFIWDGYSWGYVYGAFCSIVVLPSTHDFGTVQYAGPSETPYSVPATTVTYSTLGYTPCGGQVRKTTTKTYSARSVPNSWKVTDTMYGNVAYGVPVGPYGTFTGYGLTNNAAVDDFASKITPPATLPFTGFWGTLDFDTPSLSVSYSPNAVQFIYHGTGAAAGISLMGIYGYPGGITLTLYYLDVHEVWTYDLI